MKRLLTYLICAAFVFSLNGDLQAVEKKQKKESSKKTAQQKPGSSKSVRKTPVKKQTALKSQKKYDTFIDRNNNGIDDRREKLKPKVASKSTAKKKPAPKKKAASKDKSKE